MKDRKILVIQSGFNLVQVDSVNAGSDTIRTSYEVVDPEEDAIGRFGSLKEAQNFINMLCLLKEQNQAG
jgi:hypothetical protein